VPSHQTRMTRADLLRPTRVMGGGGCGAEIYSCCWLPHNNTSSAVVARHDRLQRVRGVEVMSEQAPPEICGKVRLHSDMDS